MTVSAGEISLTTLELTILLLAYLGIILQLGARYLDDDMDVKQLPNLLKSIMGLLTVTVVSAALQLLQAPFPGGADNAFGWHTLTLTFFTIAVIYTLFVTGFLATLVSDNDEEDENNS